MWCHSLYCYDRGGRSYYGHGVIGGHHPVKTYQQINAIIWYSTVATKHNLLVNMRFLWDISVTLYLLFLLVTANNTNTSVLVHVAVMSSYSRESIINMNSMGGVTNEGEELTVLINHIDLKTPKNVMINYIH